ncbi:ABC-2 transporter permease [Salipaludibacillus agaradhaerens]|uniref:ABC transporter permease n=1 Tax=Salipaludibacillus agaradhaerens TaxID=76935 RepID=UPI0021506EED|nr:ABC-2 transporter permease [Salipaludibacillus agaradhaerens]MCR6107490.1 ABC-2 transporter permease [Salipaludibacillus agaradhaerens]MCR6119519.1 ABC-2 transporter permease [Salipaludibacillus agaradhaerens]
MAQKIIAKTGHLSRFILRLDRLRIPLWLIGLTVFTLIIPPAFDNLYETQQEREAITDTMANPAMTAMLGPGNLDNYTLGAMMTHQMLLMTAVIVGLMSILVVARHTRADEEEGRIEMIRSLPVGRLSYLNASLLVIIGTSLILGLLVGFGLTALGIESMNLEGSLLYGAALGGTGLIFAGVTAVSAQLSGSSRGTVGLSLAVLLIAYLFRSITDVSNDTLSWLSPLGWVSKTDAYSENHWGPIILMLVLSIILYVLANYLNSIRDLEQGFLPAKSGRRRASRFLQSPLGLALRLQRTGMIAWAIGLFVLGASYGSIFGDLESFIEGNDMYENMLVQVEGISIVEQFLPTLMIVIALIATVPPLMAMNKLRGEEKKGRSDHLLARAVSRIRLMGGYLVLSLVNGFIMLSVSTFGLWAAGAAVMDDGLEFTMVYGAGIVFYPAMIVMIGLAVLLIGCLPKLTQVTWIYLLYSFIVVYLGQMFQFPDWVAQLTPFGHIQKVPIEDASFLTLFILSAIAVVVIMMGFIGYRKRDMESN